MILLDTCLIIDVLGGEERAGAALRELTEREEVCTSTINMYELFKGAYSVKESQGEKCLEAVEEFRRNIRVIGLNTEASKKAAQIYAELKVKGQMVEENDCLLGGICLTEQMGIFTKNVKHFQRIEGLEVLGY